MGCMNRPRHPPPCLRDLFASGPVRFPKVPRVAPRRLSGLFTRERVLYSFGLVGNGSTSRQHHRSSAVRLWFSTTEIGHLGIVVLSDLSRAIFEALNEALPNDDHQLVWRVEVFEGWGGAHFVTVCSPLYRRDAATVLTEIIHAVVDRVLVGRRHVVRIIWAI
jgi:hypothetical protein